MSTIASNANSTPLIDLVNEDRNEANDSSDFSDFDFTQLDKSSMSHKIKSPPTKRKVEDITYGTIMKKTLT
jgi:hypothetical protein